VVVVLLEEAAEHGYLEAARLDVAAHRGVHVPPDRAGTYDDAAFGRNGTNGAKNRRVAAKTRSVATTCAATTAITTG
jgi:hypothetical protein